VSQGIEVLLQLRTVLLTEVLSRRVDCRQHSGRQQHSKTHQESQDFR